MWNRGERLRWQLFLPYRESLFLMQEWSLDSNHLHQLFQMGMLSHASLIVAEQHASVRSKMTSQRDTEEFYCLAFSVSVSAYLLVPQSLHSSPQSVMLCLRCLFWLISYALSYMSFLRCFYVLHLCHGVNYHIQFPQCL